MVRKAKPQNIPWKNSVIITEICPPWVTKTSARPRSSAMMVANMSMRNGRPGIWK